MWSSQLRILRKYGAVNWDIQNHGSFLLILHLFPWLFVNASVFVQPLTFLKFCKGELGGTKLWSSQLGFLREDFPWSSNVNLTFVL